jgi:hypothetical protein
MDNLEALQAELQQCPQLASLLNQLMDEFLRKGQSPEYMRHLERLGQILGKV